MDEIIVLHKPAGKTPLETLELYRKTRPELEHIKMSYAGRLDPLAQGVLLILIGEACKRREEYLNLEKTYTFTVLLGIQTDSYDVLGLVQPDVLKKPPQLEKVKEIVTSFVNNSLGKHTYSYPPFSSKTVQGKPLFWWAKSKKLNQIVIPSRVVTISEFNQTGYEQISREKLKSLVQRQIASVKGDFRQEEVQSSWHTFFETHTQLHYFTTVDFTIRCSSGTYVRELAYLLGATIGCGALCLRILRTSVGNFT